MTNGSDSRGADPLPEAAAWRVRLAERDQETSPAFEAWLAAAPEHAEAWAQVDGPWARFSDEATAPELMRARRDALDYARRAHARRVRRPMGRPTVARVAAGAVCIACIASAAILAGNLPGRAQLLETGVGERRTAVLADGSRLSLDSDTAVSVRLEPDHRRLVLLRGQARFEVAHDAARPFEVRAGDELVRATGTSFDVDMLSTSIRVTLLQGRVTVFRMGGGAAYRWAPPLRRGEPGVVLARLEPGERLTFGLSKALVEAPSLASRPLPTGLRIERVPAKDARAWETGRIFLENEPLAAVAERMNRYGGPRLQVEGAARDLRLSGVFDANDGVGFLDAVQRALPVQATASSDGVVRLRQNGQMTELRRIEGGFERARRPST